MTFLKTHKLILSMVLSILLLILGYFINNLPVFTGENLDQFFITQKVCEYLGLNNDLDNSDALFVNVSYDKELVQVKGLGPLGIVGNTTVTNRAKLYDLLKILNDDGEYKYVILDLMFDPNEVTESDSLLYSLIESMNNIVIIRDDNIPVPTEGLMHKAALADYYATITATNFVRYQYLSGDNIKYIPLKVYEDLNQGVEFRKHGLNFLPIYTSGRKLCYNSCFIAFDSDQFSSFSEITKDYAEKNFYNLGSDLVANPILTKQEQIERVATLSQDKYVVIGNLTEDLHDTYMGVRPGSFIMYRALKTLEEGKHIVKFWQIIYWFISFTLIFWWMISDFRLRSIIPRRLRHSKLGKLLFNNKLLSFIFASLTYAFVLFVLSTLEYAVTQKIYSIVLPCYVFMLTKLIYDYTKFTSDEN